MRNGQTECARGKNHTGEEAILPPLVNELSRSIFFPSRFVLETDFPDIKCPFLEKEGKMSMNRTTDHFSA